MVRQRMGFAKSLRRLEEAAAELLAKHAPGTTDYRATVATAWLVTTQAMSAEARAILRLSAAMGSAPVPLEMLTDGAPQVVTLGATPPELRARRSWLPFGGARGAGPQRAPPAPDKAKARRAVEDAVGGELHAYSMIQHWNGELFRVHRLVRDVEWGAMDKAARRYACGLFARMLETHAPADPRDQAERDACDAALVHGARAVGAAEGSGSGLAGREIGRCALRVRRGARVVAAAEDYALEHYEAAKKRRGPISDVTRGLRLGSRTVSTAGRVARRCRSQVILHATKCGRPGASSHTLTSMNNLAGCMQALGDAAGALPLYRRALDSYERVLGKEHPDTLTSVNNLAECMRALGDAAGALPLYRRALDSRERVLGKEHPDTLASVNNLAECMEALGDAAGALPLYRRALDGQRARARQGASRHAHQREQSGRMHDGAGRRGGGFAALPPCARQPRARARQGASRHARQRAQTGRDA